jgi:mannitol-1-phosphate/altronate dehydrogenase
MSKNPPTPLSPREREALDRLEEWVDGWDDAKPREAVIEQLTAGEFERGHADRVIDRLLSKGYLYEHEGIHVTDPP